ncbi:Hypothetical predicted protein, partial [Marmota monax]
MQARLAFTSVSSDGPTSYFSGIVSAESREAGEPEFECSRSGLHVCVLRGPDCLPQIHVSSALPSDPEQTAFRQFTTPYARAAGEVRDLISPRRPP